MTRMTAKMNAKRTFARRLGIGAALMAMAAAPLSATAAEPDDAIKYRKAVMGAVGAHTSASALILKGQVDHADALPVHAAGVAAAAKLAKAAFEQNTDGQGKEKTTAKGAVWENADDFGKRLAALEENADAFAEAAASGDMGAAGAALGELGKTCKGCHDEYRNK